MAEHSSRSQDSIIICIDTATTTTTAAVVQKDPTLMYLNQRLKISVDSIIIYIFSWHYIYYRYFIIQ